MEYGSPRKCVIDKFYNLFSDQLWRTFRLHVEGTWISIPTRHWKLSEFRSKLASVILLSLSLSLALSLSLSS